MYKGCEPGSQILVTKNGMWEGACVLGYENRSERQRTLGENDPRRRSFA
jgi:hypothetical protein